MERVEAISEVTSTRSASFLRKRGKVNLWRGPGSWRGEASEPLCKHMGAWGGHAI